MGMSFLDIKEIFLSIITSSGFLTELLIKNKDQQCLVQQQFIVT